MSHTFSVAASWKGGLKGQGHLEGRTITSVHAAPTELGGAGVGVSPEELLVSAAASCYLITLAAILERRGVSVDRIELSSVVGISKTLSVESITHTPRIFVLGGDDQTLASAAEAATRAEAICLVTNAMRGNVPVLVNPDVVRVERAA